MDEDIGCFRILPERLKPLPDGIITFRSAFHYCMYFGEIVFSHNLILHIRHLAFSRHEYDRIHDL